MRTSMHRHTYTHIRKKKQKKHMAICRQLMIPVSISHLKQHAVSLAKHAHTVISLLGVRPSGSSLPGLCLSGCPLCIQHSH